MPAGPGGGQHRGGVSQGDRGGVCVWGGCLRPHVHDSIRPSRLLRAGLKMKLDAWDAVCFISGPNVFFRVAEYLTGSFVFSRMRRLTAQTSDTSGGKIAQFNLTMNALGTAPIVGLQQEGELTVWGVPPQTRSHTSKVWMPIGPSANLLAHPTLPQMPSCGNNFLFPQTLRTCTEHMEKKRLQIYQHLRPWSTNNCAEKIWRMPNHKRDTAKRRGFINL